MIDDMLGRLQARDGERRLDLLEQDIWERERSLKAASAANRRLASWQGLVLSLAVLLSAAGGATAARAVPPPPTDWFGGTGQSTPATLLFGGEP
jgi:hypothetical protein